LVDRLRRHPLARALRVDKLTVAAVESLLRLYATGQRYRIPIWSTLAVPAATIQSRARALASVLKEASVRQSGAVAGGGALPGHSFPSAELVVSVRSPGQVAARLRAGRPAVFCRMEAGIVAFDLRTVAFEDDDRLLRAIRYALEQG
jgi:L-seryl-tRNA(Ser) seleniumtransferase